jgi:hypothetical protein|tara:strand:- start:951 stop:1166 length:216 start_codon:yes stop_codon:yes gene_type:complete
MPPRASTQRRSSPSRAANKYDYTEISKVELSSDTEKVSFYGVIIDATFPYQFTTHSNGKEGGKMFLCNLKV